MLIRRVFFVIIISLVIHIGLTINEKFNEFKELEKQSLKSLKAEIEKRDRFKRLKKILIAKKQGKEKELGDITLSLKDAKIKIKSIIKQIQDNKYFFVNIDKQEKIAKFLNVIKVDLTIKLVNGKGILNISDYQQMLKEHLAKELYIDKVVVLNKRTIQFKTYLKKEI